MRFDLSENINKKYKNFISLGYFCEVAGDLEKLGLRSTSSPFDWCISDFPCIIRLMDTGFAGFMQKKNMAQSVQNRDHYMDRENKIFFFHDFTRYRSFGVQYKKVKEKYERRICRFLCNIKAPTLFVRYISSEIKEKDGRSAELAWIENHTDEILQCIRKYNQQNDIVFIGDETVRSELIKIYPVKKDENDAVSRSPIMKNQELLALISRFEPDGQEQNKEFYAEKQKRKKTGANRKKESFILRWNRHFQREYHYREEYNIPGK